MQTFRKKFLAALLVFCMMLSFVPFGALAAGETEIAGQQLSLGDDLTMHFFVNVEEQYTSTAVVTVTAGGTTATYNIGSMTASEKGYDCYIALGAPQMTEEIQVTVTAGETQLLQQGGYSIQKYAHYLLEGNYTAETKALAKELLNYGAKAQLYFDYNTEDLANAGYEITTEAAISSEAPAISISDKLNGISYHGSSMVFESKIAVRHYFYAPSGVNGYTFTVDGKAYTPVLKNGYYYIEVTGINPDQMDTEMAVSVTKDGGALTFGYSPMAYIIRMYNKESSGTALKDMLLAANGYFAAAKVFTGVAENRTGTMTMAYRYGTNNLIQVNTNLPSDTPCANFTAGDNGCSIDQSNNQYQQFGWVGMDNVDGTIVLTFHFNGAFEAGQNYTLPKGAVFGFTDGSKYTLDKNYTFSFDGSGWSMEAKEPAVTLSYRYGTGNLIQFNTDLPSDTPCNNFLIGDNGCSIDESANKYQNVAWIGMDNVDGVIVLSFHFNGSFSAGQNYILPAGAIFGFTNGNKYVLETETNLYWDGAQWSAEAPSVSFQYRYGTGNLIQVNTNLPSDTPCVNFTAGDNGCSIDQSNNQYQQFGWVGMDNVDGTIVLTFHFNNAFEAGQTYTLPAGAIFGFTNGYLYHLDGDYTFTFDGSAWSADTPSEEPDVTEPEETEPAVTEPSLETLNFQYRYGTSTLFQVNTDLPATTPINNFLASDNGCNLIQSGDQQVGWIGMADAEGTIVLTFNFNGAFSAGQSYTLAAGSVFGFTDGNKYALDRDYTFTFDGSSWSIDEPAAEEKNISLSYRYGAGNLIQYNTDLPATTPINNFLASDNGCNLLQSGDQQVGWIGMANADGTIVLTFNFNGAFSADQSYTLAAGSVFGFTDGSSYTLAADVTLYYDGSAWTAEEPAKQIGLSYRFGTAELIQVNTDLPATTPIANFLASDNGCNLIQSGNQQVGWIGMENVEGTIVLTFHFNSAFTFGQSYKLSAGSVFGFTDGCSYTLAADIILYWDDSDWVSEEPVATDVLDESNFTGGDVITFADLPVDSRDPAKIQEYKELGFNTSLLTEDHTGAKGPDELYTVSLNTANAPSDSLNFQYRYGTSKLIQVNTNLPADTPCVNFTVSDNGCDIDQSGNTVQWVGWIGMENVDGTIVLTFHFNNDFQAGQSYVLPKDALFCFTDDSMYLLDADYTFTFDGTTWSTESSVLNFSLNAGSVKYIQLKTNIPTGLSYGDFLLGDTSKGNLILETTEGAQSVAWFSYSELSGAVYLTFNFNGLNKPGTQYIMKAGTSLKAGDKVYTTDRDYILTVGNDYLQSLENLDNAGLNVWIRNYHNTADYFTSDLTAALMLYKDTIDGFYMVDEMFQTEALKNASGQTATSDFAAMEAVRDWFNLNFADKYYHSNHVPMSSWDHYTGVNGGTLSGIDVAGYQNFLTLYKQNFNDQLTNASGTSISFDNYPFVHEQGTYGGFFGIGGTFESGIQDTYLLNCLIAAQVAGEDDFGLCVQTFHASDLKNKTSRDITSAAEVSLQIYTGLAMGADLFEYFAYNSNGDFNAIMNQDGSKRIYDLVKEGNQALCFADVVNSFAWNGIVTSAGSSNSHNGDAFESVADRVLTNASNGVLDSYSSTDDAIIGCFTKDALNGYMVANFNDPAAVTGNNTVNLTFAGCTRARVYTCVDGVLTSQLVELTNGACTVTLAPGAGCFVIPA